MNNKPVEGALAIFLVGAIFSILNVINGLSGSSTAGGFLVGSLMASVATLLLGASRGWVKFPTLPLLGILVSEACLAIGMEFGVYFGMLIFSIMAVVHDRVAEPK